MRPDPSSDAPPTVHRQPIRHFLRQIGPAGPVALIATAMPALGAVALAAVAPKLAPWLTAHRATGVVVFVAGFSTLGGFALVPTYANSILGGWSFKFGIGSLAVLLCLLGSATISYMLARWIVGHRVRHALHEHPKWEIVRDALVGGSSLKVAGIIALIRLSPVLPFETTNVLLASCEVKLVPYLVGTMLGVAPRTLAMVFLAAHARKLDLAAAGGWGLLIVGIVASIVIVALMAVIARHALKRAVG